MRLWQSQLQYPRQHITGKEHEGRHNASLCPSLNESSQQREPFQQASLCAHDTWSKPRDTVQILAVPSVAGITLSSAVHAASVC